LIHLESTVVLPFFCNNCNSRYTHTSLTLIVVDMFGKKIHVKYALLQGDIYWKVRVGATAVVN
jgi:hypothetical protein